MQWRCRNETRSLLKFPTPAEIRQSLLGLTQGLRLPPAVFPYQLEIPSLATQTGPRSIAASHYAFSRELRSSTLQASEARSASLALFRKSFVLLLKEGVRDPRMSTIPRIYRLAFVGDVMIGRLIDALLPTSIARKSPHSDPEDAARTVDNSILARYPELTSYNYLSPWGNSVSLLQKADLILANLETALTRSERQWPNKAFNYRSHPENVRCLTEVGMGGGDGRGYVSLANNHTLDWQLEGLNETVETLSKAGVQYAGAGRSAAEAATSAELNVGGEDGWKIKCWSFADHPLDWEGVDAFNLIDYTKKGREKISLQLADGELETDKVGLKVVSVHWGPNYGWHPAVEIVDLAHWMIDECGVDIVHGHSSHHIQGVEVYNGKLIIYGCGDFIDDYAVDLTFRNDLSALWRVTVGERAGEERSRLEVKKLELFPNRIQRFQAHLLEASDVDHNWIERKFRILCDGFGTTIVKELGSEGQIVIDIQAQD